MESTVKAIVTGAETGSAEGDGIVGDVIVNWHPPRWFVTLPAPVTTIAGANDPDTPAGQEEPDADTMQLAREWEGRQKQAVQVTATLTTLVLETYVEIAKLPMYELGGQALLTIPSKISGLVEKVAEVRQLASEATTAAADARRLAQEGRQAGKAAEEVAEMEQTAVAAEKAATEATEEATKAEQVAASAQRRLAGAKRLDGWAKHLTKDDLVGAQRELQGEVVGINPADGQPWDHLGEVRMQQSGLIQRIEVIKQRLSWVGLYEENPAEAVDLQEELAACSKLLDLSEQYVPRI